MNALGSLLEGEYNNSSIPCSVCHQVGYRLSEVTGFSLHILYEKEQLAKRNEVPFPVLVHEPNGVSCITTIQ
ncbi:hypothetical protein VNO77_09624 [Canavalia gladiata]|uniref:Uncharacterized protein n=1 Tax=Canavalia gladiata TaxID=3824 RepID=A0AAN9QXF9_CANGL